MNDFQKIPKELTQLNQWVCWKKINKKDGKATKIPINPYNGRNAKSNDKRTWSDFITAINSVGLFDLDGIGFMFDAGYFGVDLDDCSDSLKTEFINELQSYTEISQSGNGIHIICKGKLPEGNRRRNNVEMYDSGRFFVMTGNSIGDFEITDCTEKIKALHEKYLSDKKKESYFEKRVNNLVECKLDDKEVIQKASESKSGALFQSLFAGEYESIYGSQSEADLALCNMLAFWTGKDFVQMDRIFRMSGLYRPKWDEKRGSKKYGEITIENAISSCSNVYSKKFKKEDYSVDEKTGEVKYVSTKKYDLNDTGNAKRVYDYFGDIIRYNVENKCWVIWNGVYWKQDNQNKIKFFVEKVAEDIKNEALNEEDEKRKKELNKCYNRLMNSSGKEACLKELQHINEIPVCNNDFDKLNNFLNIKNGVINLRTGELLPHKKELMISKAIDIELVEGKPTAWIKFLNEIFLGDKELISFIKKAVGYTLTGSTREQCLFICLGEGSNGKSVFLDVISNLLGEYSTTAQVESIMVNKNYGGGANTDIARLKGARFVTTSEPNEYSRLNEGLIKQLTGGDKVTARFLYGKEFEFKPEFKLWVATNHKPIIRGTDNGIWRRIMMIPFDATFTKEQQDKNLLNKLNAELPKILAWALEGCRQWIDEGLEAPGKIQKATSEYKKEMDVLSNFLLENVVEDEGGSVKASLIYKEYVKWAKENNEYEMSSTKFGKEISKKYEKVKKSDGIYYKHIKMPVRYN